VKLENVVFEWRSGHAALLDFGLALLQKNKGGRLDVACGSQAYFAPEMVELHQLASTAGRQGMPSVWKRHPCMVHRSHWIQFLEATWS
jgi:serine/threonine protein kinase